MTYATSSLLHVRQPPRRDSVSRHRSVFKTLTVGLLAVVIVLFSITAVVIGVGRTSSAFLQAQANIQPVASLALPQAQLAHVDLSGGAIGTRWPVIADLIPSSPTITVASAPPPEAARVADATPAHPILDAASVKVQDRLGASRVASPRSPAMDQAAADPEHTGSLGRSLPKPATAGVASVGVTTIPPVQTGASPVPLPQPRIRLAALPRAGDAGTGDEGAHAPKTAIYDITAQTVYLPNGERMEAHSGLGALMDNPRHVRQKNRGATPPNTYNLRLREALFHGVQAIRMTPVDDDRMFNRDGILAHSYMLGPSGQSNGCISFKDYPKFLHAFMRGEIERIVVVARLDTPPRFFARANIRSANANNAF